MKFDIALQRGHIWRIQDRRKRVTAQACGNERRGSTLATADQKVAPANIDRILPLRWLSQTLDLRICRWNRNLTATSEPVKVELKKLPPTELNPGQSLRVIAEAYASIMIVVPKMEILHETR